MTYLRIYLDIFERPQSTYVYEVWPRVVEDEASVPSVISINAFEGYQMAQTRFDVQKVILKGILTFVEYPKNVKGMNYINLNI